jgi:hypothetical protein
MPITEEELGIVSEELVGVNLDQKVYKELKEFKRSFDEPKAARKCFPEIMDPTMPYSYQQVGESGVVMIYYEGTFHNPHTMGGWVSEYINCAPERYRGHKEVGFVKQGNVWGTPLPRIGFDLTKKF